MGDGIIVSSLIDTEIRFGYAGKEFSAHTGVPVRTLEDWEAGRRTPPEYIPRLIEYQMKYEKLVKSNNRDEIRQNRRG